MTKRKIIIYEIKYIFVKFILPTIFLLFYFYVLIAKPFSESINYALIFICFFPLFLVPYLLTDKSCRNKFKDKCSEVYEYYYDDINSVVEKVKNNSKHKGYMYEKSLKTDENEVFVINATDENDFPLGKIGVYINNIYMCECYHYGSRFTSGGYVPGEGKTHYLYKPFFNMICGKWGRSYDHPRDWINIEATIIVIVDEWNDSLNWALNNGGHLPFVLFCAIVRCESNKLFIAKDTRKERRNDYFKKRNELFDLLEVKNRDVIGNLSWRDVCKKIRDKN